MKGQYTSKGTMVLRTLLIYKGQKRRGGNLFGNASSIKREKRERVLGNSIELFCVSFEVTRVLYLYRDFITGLS